MNNNYCTMCSMEYCYQGMVLYNSLVRHDKDFKLFIVCLDNKMVQFLDNLRYSNLIPIDVRYIEENYKELLEIKQQRNTREYAWTLKPSIVLYIFENFDFADHVLWLDSDMQFLSSPEPLYKEWDGLSILLSEQYYTDAYEYLVSGYGKYQAGFIGFRRNKIGFECLRWWQERCMEWCSDKAEKGKWADQKYLDEFPQRFNDVGVVNNFGINLTSFIIYRVNTEQGKVIVKKPDGLYIDNVKIILYHYYGLRFYEHNEYDLSCYWMMFDKETIKLVYMPYIMECQESVREIQASDTLRFQLKGISENQVLNYFNMDRANRAADYDICMIVCKSDLIKCMTFYNFIAQNSKKVHLWICCVDSFSYAVLSYTRLYNVTVINSANFETKELLELKKICEEKEYVYILKAHFLYYILKNNFPVKFLFYMGTEICFYTSLIYLNKILGKGSIFLYKHPKTNEGSKGSFRTDLIGFKSDKNALDCLISWKDKSLDWHFERANGNEYPEENYISTLPSCICGVRVLEEKCKPLSIKLQQKHSTSLRSAVLAIKKVEGIIENQ